MTAAAASDEAILDRCERLALLAGREVMRVFQAGCDVHHKSDQSPVTEADRESERIILEGLRRAFPEIPCVAEEEAAAGILPAALGRAFFLIDPLDGTREFVNRRTDFTVNIALVRDGAPVIGVVLAPCTGRLFAGRPGLAQVADIDAAFTVASRRSIAARVPVAPLAVVASRSHNNAETDAYIRNLGAAEIVSVGSSPAVTL